MKKLAVAMLAPCPFPANRGTPSRVKGMAEAFAERGHRVAVVTYHLGLDVPVHGVEIHRIPRFSYDYFGPGPTLTKLALLDPCLLFKLVQLLRANDFDIIHAHHYEGALLATVARALSGCPYIYDAHTTLQSELPSYGFRYPQWLARYLDHGVPRAANHVIACSDKLRNSMTDAGIARDKIDVIPTGVAPADFAAMDGGAIRSQYGLGNVPIVMYTGSLAEFQRVDLLIKAMSRVIVRAPDAVLFAVVPRDGQRIREQCAAAGLANNLVVAVEPHFERVPEYLAAADIAVVPRVNCAGIPQKLVNYMAAKKAIVSFESSASVLRHGHDGIIVEDGDAEAFAKAICDLVDDRAKRHHLGLNAGNAIRGQLDWASLAEKLETVYAKVLRRAYGGEDEPRPENSF